MRPWQMRPLYVLTYFRFSAKHAISQAPLYARLEQELQEVVEQIWHYRELGNQLQLSMWSCRARGRVWPSMARLRR